jgi:hypothetical protein
MRNCFYPERAISTNYITEEMEIFAMDGKNNLFFS